MADYIPSNDGARLPWLENYATKIAVHGPTTGVAAGDVTAVVADIGSYQTAFNALVTKRAETQGLTTSLREAEKALLAKIRNMVGGMRRHSGWTDSKGDELQVNPPQADVNPDLFKPKFTAASQVGSVLIEFEKGLSDGVNIYGRLKGQANWTFIARDTNSPYEDHRPLTQPNVPEVREYMLRAVRKDAEFGLTSSIEQVAFAG